MRHVDKLSAFGRSVKLLTVRYPGLGLHSARFEMLTSRGIGSNATNDSEEEQEGFEAVHSECMNPITDAHWQVLTNSESGVCWQNLQRTYFFLNHPEVY